MTSLAYKDHKSRPQSSQLEGIAERVKETAMELAVAIVLLAALVTSSHASSRVEDPPFPLPIHLLRPLSGSGAHRLSGVTCESWRVAVEANNMRGWKTIPRTCEGYVGHYMLGGLYRRDSAVVAGEAAKYAESLDLRADGKDVWVFDVDETTLSNLPYYARHGFGVELYNATSFNAWVMKGKAPALPESLELYKKLLSLGIKIVFLTGRTEDQRDITAHNLKMVGYHTWEKLLLKGLNVSGSSVAYKSGMRQKLEEEGYSVVGNIGDQWSDILGQPEGGRTFKVPDPMYYIS
ncbi:acid phosphatase 1-like [Phoenix dactylifera]|uniref:Acid phosphatase 1-like n=1 Tax=Phoenix dactylifera TaxID=42345 RepID=A0A8B7CGM3_PHODC|nr:acid phosphatase 1-like [Phoenix dactylifera]